MTPYIFRIFGLTEEELRNLLPQEIVCLVESKFPFIDITVEEDAKELLETSIPLDYVFANSPNVSLESSLHDILIEKELKIAAAESCTGGMVGMLLSNTPGASKYFLGSAVTYSNAAKSKLINVNPYIIATHGAVSFEVAMQMAKGAREAFGASIAVSTTGIAGPDGGTPEKPVGLFFVGLSTEEITSSYKVFFSGDRNALRIYAAYTALDIARRYALNLPIYHETKGHN